MTTAIAEATGTYERAMIQGDLSRLSEPERLGYYKRVCESLGLNPLTQPFDYIVLNGKMKLYAKKDATDQLRSLNHVSIVGLDEAEREGVYIVTARAETNDGRKDQSKGAVNLGGLKGEALANAIMKAETKAKRRVTLSICGLGWLDETEVDDIRGAHHPTANGHTQEQLPAPTFCSAEQLAEVHRLMGLAGVTEEKFRELLKVGTSADLPANRYEGTVNSLNRKIAAIQTAAEAEREANERDGLRVEDAPAEPSFADAVPI